MYDNMNLQTTATVDPEARYIPPVTVTVRQPKGGVFSPADMPLIKRALNAYLSQLVIDEESEREASQELIQLSNLLHRINNRA